MMKHPVRLLPLLATATLVLAPAAQAQELVAPPGNAGVEQYAEVVPSAGGGTPRQRVESESASGGASKLPRRTTRALESAGSDGEQLLRAVEATTPPGAASAGQVAAAREAADRSSGSSPSTGSTPGGQSASGAGPEATTGSSLPDRGTVAAAADAVVGTTGNGTPWLLPSVLLLISLGLGTVALRRTRSA